MLAEALDSIARQTLQRYEVLVVDDCSDSRHEAAYASVVTRLGVRFRFLQTGAPSRYGNGPAISRNRGLEYARGRYVAFLDDDDAWTWDDHLRAAIETLDDTGADLHCADMQGFRDGQLVVASWLDVDGRIEKAEQVRPDPPTYRVPSEWLLTVTKRRTIHTNMLVIRRSLVTAVGGFSVGQRFGEDAEFVLRLLDRTSSVLVSPVAVARYRCPEGDSHSLTMSQVEEDLQMLTAARRVGTVAHSAAVRRVAADMEGWSLRALSRHARSKGRHGTACRLALQAFIAYPTPGALVEMARALLPWRRSLMLGRGQVERRPQHASDR